MDVMQPRILVVNGRQYRLNTADCYSSIDDDTKILNEVSKNENLPSYVEKDDFEDECDDLNIYMESGWCILKLEAPNAFYGLIIGRNRETLKNLEYQTKTRIQIPGPREKNITIKGELRTQVVAAKLKIDAIIKKGRFRQSVTHFVSMPMVNQNVIDNYLTFKKIILEEYNQCRGISELLFHNHLRLHLTITCFVLCDATEIKKATKLMKQCEETIIKPMNLNTLDVLVYGLDYMNDDPSEIRVLYAKVKNPEIQMLANKIQTYFQDCGLALQPRNDQVKLHVTLMNSSFYEFRNRDGDCDKKSRHTFDAKKIVENFSDYTFGMVQLTEIHLSQRFTTDSNGYYKSSYIIKL